MCKEINVGLVESKGCFNLTCNGFHQKIYAERELIRQGVVEICPEQSFLTKGKTCNFIVLGVYNDTKILLRSVHTCRCMARSMLWMVYNMRC